MKRFVSRRGYPKFMISDNAKCFIGPELKSYLKKHNITWEFIPEKTPWWGGFWERLVQMVKKPLRKILGKASVSYDELLTIITEIEGVLNCRPLCYQYSDQIEEVITPSHLMFGRRILSRDDYNNELEHYTETIETCNKRLNYVNTLISSFEKQWRHEYLTGLREKQLNTNLVPAKQIKKDDIVLICDEISHVTDGDWGEFVN